MVYRDLKALLSATPRDPTRFYSLTWLNPPTGRLTANLRHIAIRRRGGWAARGFKSAALHERPGNG
jgi:hypothetical protein